MTLRIRLTAAMVVLVGVTAAAVAFLGRRAVIAYAIPEGFERLGTHVRLLADDVEGSVRAVRADMLALGGFPDTEEALHEDAAGRAARDRLSRMFHATLEARASWVQLRLIDADGIERVRVDRPNTGGTVRVVAPEALQDKSQRAYFTEAMALAPGEVYVSPIELNVENDEIQSPFLPVLRVAVTLPGSDGTPSGIAIANVGMDSVLQRLRAATTAPRRVYLVADDGHFVLHPDTAQEFASQRGVPAEPWSDLEGVAPLRDGNDAVVTKLVQAGARSRGVGFARLRLAGGPGLTLVVTEPESALLAGASSLLRSAVLAGVLAALAAMALAALIAHSLSRPVQDMVDSVRRMESTGEWVPPTHPPGELGVLSGALTTMVETAREKSVALQEENEIRRNTEDQLQRETARLRLLSAVANSSSDAIYTKSFDGILTSWNPGAEGMYGYTADQVVGRNVAVLVPDDRQDELAWILDELRAGRAISGLETTRLTKDGRSIEVSLTLSPVRAKSGALIGASVIARDITERRILEERFRQAVEASPNGMLMVDEAGSIVLVNNEIERLFGYEREELMGRPVETLVPDHVRGGHAALREEYAAEPTRRAMGAGRELFGRCKDGTEVPVEVGLNPIVTTEGGRFVLASVVDISKRKRAEDDLRRSNAELEQFAYVASHDLQEPLRMVASYTELLRTRYQGQLDERADKYIHYAVDGARRMQLLITDLLQFSRVNTKGRPFEPTDVADVASRVVSHALGGAVVDADARVEVGEMPTVMADEVQIAQVFQNLIANAIKFRSPDRKPTVKVTADYLSDERLWRFAVEDNGIGIEPEYQQRVFEMFQRLHGLGEYEGSGIGLTLARKIVERHNGTIWFESSPGSGTTFFFTLPGGAP